MTRTERKGIARQYGRVTLALLIAVRLTRGALQQKLSRRLGRYSLGIDDGAPNGAGRIGKR